MSARREAERRAQHANQEITQANIRQQKVDGGPQHLVAAEEHENQEVVDESESADEAQAHRHEQVASRTEGVIGGGRLQMSLHCTEAQRAVRPPAADHTQVGHNHRNPFWVHIEQKSLPCFLGESETFIVLWRFDNRLQSIERIIIC